MALWKHYLWSSKIIQGLRGMLFGETPSNWSEKFETLRSSEAKTEKSSKGYLRSLSPHAVTVVYS